MSIEHDRGLSEKDLVSRGDIKNIKKMAVKTAATAITTTTTIYNTFYKYLGELLPEISHQY